MTNNYGVAIILFTALTKIILFPLSYWMHINSIKMVKIYPLLNRVKARYYGDKNTIADKQLELYKKEGYHPIVSTIPLIIQIVLLMAVTEVIFKPVTYILNKPQNITDSLTEIYIGRHPEEDKEASGIQLFVVEDIQNDNAAQYKRADTNDLNIKNNETVNLIKDLKMEFLGFNIGWIPSEHNGEMLTIPLIAALSSLLLSLAQNRMNILQSEQSSLNKWGMLAFSSLLSLVLGFFVPYGVAIYWVSSNLLAIIVQLLLNRMKDPKSYIDMDELQKSKDELAKITEHNKDSNTRILTIFSEEARRVRRDYRKFFNVSNKHLVFYSESSGFYKYYKGYIEYILKYTNIPIHYITNDPDDIIFDLSKENDQIVPYYIDPNSLITMMMKMDSDIVVMTMPDLETYQIKRSLVRKDIEYINVMHGMGSVNLTYRTGSLDHFDTVFAANRSQKEEIIKTERVNNLPEKTIIKAGYPLIDEMIDSFKKNIKHDSDRKKNILIAPSWQTDNIIDLCLEEILDNLKGNGFEITVRPHPQHVRHMPEKMEYLKKKYEQYRDITIQTDFSSNSTIFEADLLITDWSDISFEFAFVTHKPVLFINTPMKIMNPEYEKIDTIPLNIRTRDIIGTQLEVSEISKILNTVKELLSKEKEFYSAIESLMNEEMYNIGKSLEIGARYIIERVFENIRNKYKEEHDEKQNI